jgi:hypothetical protein
MNRADSFDRADTTSNIGTPSDGGSNWSVLTGTWGISSNKAYTSAAVAHSLAALEAAENDVAVEMTSGGTWTEGGIIARCSDNANYLLVAIQSTGFSFYKVVAGGFTLLGSGGLSPVAPGEVYKFAVDGDLLEFFKNGSSQGSVTDSALLSNTKHGLRTYNDTALRFDDFSISSIGISTKIMALIRDRRITETPGVMEFSIEWTLSVAGEVNGTVPLLQDCSTATDAEIETALRAQLATYVSGATGQSFSGADVSGLTYG